MTGTLLGYNRTCLYCVKMISRKHRLKKKSLKSDKVNLKALLTTMIFFFYKQKSLHIILHWVGDLIRAVPPEDKFGSNELDGSGGK